MERGSDCSRWTMVIASGGTPIASRTWRGTERGVLHLAVMQENLTDALKSGGTSVRKMVQQAQSGVHDGCNQAQIVMMMSHQPAHQFRNRCRAHLLPGPRCPMIPIEPTVYHALQSAQRPTTSQCRLQRGQQVGQEYRGWGGGFTGLHWIIPTCWGSRQQVGSGCGGAGGWGPPRLQSHVTTETPGSAKRFSR